MDVRLNRLNGKILLPLNIGILNLFPLQSSNHILPIRNTILGQEPTRRLRQNQHAEDNDQTEQNLESNGESPDKRRDPGIGMDPVDAVIDPVRNQRSDGDRPSLDTDVQTSLVRLGTFGLIGRDGGGVHAVADSRDDTTDDELRQLDLIPPGSNLDDDADDHDACPRDDGPPTTETIAEYEGEDGAEETAQLVDGGDGGLDEVLVVLAALLGGREELGEVLERNQSGHDTLVVTEEEETHGGGTRDGQMQAPAIQARALWGHIGRQ